MYSHFLTLHADELEGQDIEIIEFNAKIHQLIEKGALELIKKANELAATCLSLVSTSSVNANAIYEIFKKDHSSFIDPILDNYQSIDKLLQIPKLQNLLISELGNIFHKTTEMINFPRLLNDLIACIKKCQDLLDFEYGECSMVFSPRLSRMLLDIISNFGTVVCIIYQEAPQFKVIVIDFSNDWNIFVF